VRSRLPSWGRLVLKLLKKNESALVGSGAPARLFKPQPRAEVRTPPRQWRITELAALEAGICQNLSSFRRCGIILFFEGA
jgi:hypothetical protein